MPRGGRARRVNGRGCAGTPSLSSSYTVRASVCVCVSVFEVQKSLSLSLPLSPAADASSPKLQPGTLQRGCAAVSLQMAHALHLSTQIPLHFSLLLVTSSGESRNLSVGKTGKRERRAEQTVTKQASLLPKINL